MKQHIILTICLFLFFTVTQSKNTTTSYNTKKSTPQSHTPFTPPANDINSLYNWFLSLSKWDSADEEYFARKSPQLSSAQQREISNKKNKITSKPTSSAKNPITKPLPNGSINKDSWQQISMPHIFAAPCINKIEINNKSYKFPFSQKFDGQVDRAAVKIADAKSFKIEFPTAKMSWFLYDNPCSGNNDKFASTQTRLTSDYIPNIYGLSFLGSIKNKEIGSSKENHFAIFFHKKEFRCFDGGPEYGFAFYENGKRALFYTCGDCNLNNQQWWDWPGLDGNNIGNGNVNDPENKVAKALEDPSQERYYNIKITAKGDFILEVVNPKTWQKVECTIKKPDWFPNLYGIGGYITVNAKRNDDSTANMGTFELKEIKVLEKSK